VELVELMLAAVGVGTLFGWQSFRRVRYARRHKAFLKTLDPSVEIVLHVANHEARARAQTLSALHVVYGLLQDEDFVAAIVKLGGDPEAIEGAVHAELDRFGPTPAAGAIDPHEGSMIFGRASVIAQHNGRPVSATDLWNCLARSPAGKIVEPGALVPGALLFLLTHGLIAPPEIPDATAVHIVLRNDDYTTRDFVVAILREVFELPEPEAVALMSAVHTTGRAIVGRFAVAVAKTKIDTVRTKAREHGFPLWIGAEAC
jgi:ATP-dependent Clp protease adaptor protein ClpS